MIICNSICIQKLILFKIKIVFKIYAIVTHTCTAIPAHLKFNSQHKKNSIFPTMVIPHFLCLFCSTKRYIYGSNFLCWYLYSQVQHIQLFPQHEQNSVQKRWWTRNAWLILWCTVKRTRTRSNIFFVCVCFQGIELKDYLGRKYLKF